MTKASRSWILYDSLYKTQSSAISTESTQMAIFKMTERDTARFFIWTTGWEKWQPLRGYLESNQRHFVSSFSLFSKEKIEEVQNTVKQLSDEVLQMKPAEKNIEEEITKSHFNHTVTKTFAAISLEEEDIIGKYEKEIFIDFDAEDLTMHENQKPKIDFKQINKTALKDRQDRHELQIEILLISSKGKTFRSHSKNISMSGSLLEDNIPFDYCGRVFDIVVINKQPCAPQFQRVSLKAKTVGEGLTQRIHYVQMTATVKKSLQNLLENYLETRKRLKKMPAA